MTSVQRTPPTSSYGTVRSRYESESSYSSSGTSSTLGRTKPAAYKTYTNAIAEYTATVERLREDRERRNSIHQASTTRRENVNLRGSSLALDRLGLSSSSPSSSGYSTGYVSRARASFSVPMSNLTPSRDYRRTSVLDGKDYSSSTRTDSPSATASAASVARTLLRSTTVDGSTPEYTSNYATLPRPRRTYTREESLERAREILKKTAKRDPDRDDATSSTGSIITPTEESAQSRRISRDSLTVNGHQDSGIESSASSPSRISNYDRSRSYSGLSSSSSLSLDEPHKSYSNPYSNRRSSREVSIIRELENGTPERSSSRLDRERISVPPIVATDTPLPVQKDAVKPTDENDSSTSAAMHRYRPDLGPRSRALSENSRLSMDGQNPESNSSRTSATNHREQSTSTETYNHRRESIGRLRGIVAGTLGSNSSGTEEEKEDDEDDDDHWRNRLGVGGRARSPKSGRRMQPSRKSVTVDESDKAGLTGLKNIGNTCFMNSILQCLSNTRPLRDYCTSGEYEPELNASSSHRDGPLISAFATVLEALWKRHSSYSSSNAYDPDRFHRKIQQYAPRFSGYLQQDAQEFLRYLLEGLHEDVNRVSTRPKPETTDIADYLTDAQKSAEAWKRYLKRDNSKIVELYVGQLKSSLICDKCGHCSVTFDPFWDLALPIPGNRSSALSDSNIYDCFKFFTKKEVMDGDERPNCGKCKTRQRCTKFFTIQRFPKCLVIHLKRFSQERYRAKISSLVEYPVDGLDLAPYAAESYTGPRPRYNLYAVSCHSGSTHCGHYTAFCKHPVSGKWNEYNDSRVSGANARDVVTSDAYVLFYELIS